MADERPYDERADDTGGDGREAGPAPVPGDETRTTGLPPKVERWRRRSAAGAIMTGFALGLQQVFEPERKEPSIMLETSGAPPEDLPVDVELGSLTAKRSVVRVRPWLLERTGGSDTPDAAEGCGEDHAGGEAGDPGRHDRRDEGPAKL